LTPLPFKRIIGAPAHNSIAVVESTKNEGAHQLFWGVQINMTS